MTVIEINAEIINKLYDFSKDLGCKASKNERLSDHISFKVGGPCPLLIEPKNENQLKDIITEIRKENIPFAVLGNGTNVLVSDGGIDKVIVKIGDEMTRLSLEGEDVISCSAGTKVVTLCKFALENSLSGLEFAYGIPGTCGGAVFMNAGAYGGEMKDIVRGVQAVSPDGRRTKVFSHDELDFGYRHSALQDNGWIATKVMLDMTAGDKSDIAAVMKDLNARRNAKQPVNYPSAGSTFKRPEGYFAGKLIEDAGLRGLTVGGAQVSTLHSGFIINKEGATATDILQLISLVQNTVYDKFGVMLEPEVRIIG